MRNYLCFLALGLLVSCATPQPNIIIVRPAPIIRVVPKVEPVVKKKENEFNQAVSACKEYAWQLDGCMEIDHAITEKKNTKEAKQDAEEKKIKAQMNINHVVTKINQQ